MSPIVELVGGPFDGETRGVGAEHETLRIPIHEPDGRPPSAVLGMYDDLGTAEIYAVHKYHIYTPRDGKAGKLYYAGVTNDGETGAA